MDVQEAARILGVADVTDWPAVRRAYRARISTHHPDRTGDHDTTIGVQIIEAYQVLDRARRAPAAPASDAEPPSAGSPPPPSGAEPASGARPSDHGITAADTIERIDSETIAVSAPADEVFRLLHEAAHDIGVVTYVDRSGPILEVLCRFVDQPATSLVLTLQGRATGTDIMCTSDSIEARTGPPTAAVVDLLEDALGARLGQLP